MNDTHALFWLVPIFPLFFIGLWLLVLNLLAHMGGWRSLASSYGTSEVIEGQTLIFRSVKLGKVNYNNCLRFTASYSALGMAVHMPFRPGHQPLSIPWNDISAANHQGLIFRYVDFRFAQQAQVRMRIPYRLAETLIAASGRALPIKELS